MAVNIPPDLPMKEKITRVFWCSRFDEVTPHWCDGIDGYWKDGKLGFRGSSCIECSSILVSVTCKEIKIIKS